MDNENDLTISGNEPTTVRGGTTFEFDYKDEHLVVRSSGGTNLGYPINGSRKIELALKLLGHSHVGAMISELNELRESVKNLERENNRVHREWMLQNVELSAVQKERDDLRALYMEGAEYPDE